MLCGLNDRSRPPLRTSTLSVWMNLAAQEVHMKLLRIDSSARSSSVTRQLTVKFVEEWKKNHPDGEGIQSDFSTTMLPHITDHWTGTLLDPSQVTPAQWIYL